MILDDDSTIVINNNGEVELLSTMGVAHNRYKIIIIALTTMGKWEW